MPFQPINFLNLPILKNPLEQDYVGLIKQGMQLGQEPSRLMRAREQEELTNALRKEQVAQAQAATPFAADRERADLAYKIAQAEQMRRESEMPFGNQLTGVAREAFGLELLRQQFGDDSPVYKNAEERYKADLEASKVLNQYRQSLSGITEKRAATPLGKTEMEIADILNNPNIPSDQKREMLGRYELVRQKQISDSDSRKRALFASNVDKTLSQINPKDLTQYGGLKGQAKLKADELKAATGNETKEYMDYQRSLTGAKLLAKQIRQFYGDSITPQVQEALSEMVNPATWSNNPNVALAKFNQFKKILQSETGTYRSALKETKEFQDEEEQRKSRNQELFKKQRQMAEALKKAQPQMIGEKKEESPVKRFKYVNGKWISA